MGDDETAVCPVFIRDDAFVVRIVNWLFERGLYSVAIAYPVVPVGTARIWMIVQAGHTIEQIDKCIKMFKEVAEELGYFEFMKTYNPKKNLLTSEIWKYKIKVALKSLFVPVDFSGLTPS